MTNEQLPMIVEGIRNNTMELIESSDKFIFYLFDLSSSTFYSIARFDYLDILDGRYSASSFELLNVPLENKDVEFYEIKFIYPF